MDEKKLKALAAELAKGLKTLAAPNAEALWDTVSEVDAKFISKDAFGGEPFISDMQAPLLTFTQTLRWLR
ncbi:hypothetical protein ADT37_21220, partial [Yersinia pestis subsp. microtus bv. Caucasica]|uniref:hypothetical protein n=1 Tax=Yersinia pestis TaxID=632 RepID=UPI0006CE2136